MANLVKFDMKQVPAALSEMFVRVTDTNRAELFSGVVPVLGEINLGDIGSVGQPVLFYADSFVDDNLLEFKGMFGGSVIESSSISAQSTLYLIPANGQSLQIGVTDSSNLAINTEILNDAYLYQGVNPTSLKDVEITAEDISAVVPYQETSRQTHGYSMIKTLQSSIDGQWLYASHGLGSSSVTELSAGSVMYGNGLAMMQKGVDIAAQMNAEYKIPFVQFIQGETGFSTRELDSAELDAIHNSYKSDAAAITGQSYLPMIIDQTGAYYSTECAKSRFDYVNTRSDVYMATPKYVLNRLFNNTDGDWVHLNANGYIIQGEYHGLCAAAVMNGVDFKPLQPMSYQVVGNTIEITTNAVNNLSLDSATLPQCPSEGFVYKPVLGETISPLVSISSNKMILDIGQQPRVGDLIDFGYSLDDSSTHPSGEKIPCGNIRDNQNIPSAVSGFTLHNWLVQFDYKVQRSDGVDTNIWIYEDPIDVPQGGSFGDLIAGSNNDTNAGFEVGQVYLVTLKHNGAGGFRYRVCDDSQTITGQGVETTESFTVTIGSTSNLRHRLQHESTPFEGQIYGINIELQ